MSQSHGVAMKLFIISAFFAFVILWPLLRYAMFLVSNYRSGHLAYIRTELGGLGKPIFRGVITAMMAEAIAVMSYPLAWFMGTSSKATGVPVLMVHGLFHNASAWFIFSRRLKRAGFENLHTYQYNSFTKNFSQAVDGCGKKLDTLFGDRPDGRVILIGHSLGGLVCRKVAGNSLYRERVAAMVTLGSPHKGSELALFGGNTMARDLIPGRDTPNSVEEIGRASCRERVLRLV